MAPSRLKMLVVGDLHYHSRNLPDHAALSEFLLGIEDHFDVVACMGDEFDVHNPGADVRGACVSFLRNLARKAEKMIVLVGNHTRKNNRVSGGPDHTLAGIGDGIGGDGIGDGRRVEIVEDPATFEVGGVRFMALPYMDPAVFDERVAGLPLDGAAFVLAHQEIRGGTLRPGRESECDAHWPPGHPPMISGHIHDRCTLGKVLWVGSPMQHSYAESLSKYVHVVTVEAPGDGPWREIPGGYETGGIRAWEIPVEGVPRRFKYEVDISELESFGDHVANSIDRFSIVIGYNEDAELLGSAHYRALVANPRVKVATDKKTVDVPVPAPPAETSFGLAIADSARDDPEVMAIIRDLGAPCEHRATHR